MPHQQLILTDIPKQFQEQLESLLELSGAMGISYSSANEEEIFEPEPGTTPLWEQINITAVYPHDFQLTHIISILIEKFSLERSQIKQAMLNDQKWEDAWQQYVQPMHFGNKLWVIPSCHTSPDPNAVNIELDPGLAFGSGTHPTTRLCLQWIAKNLAPTCSVIDYGCGSGILAIAAHKLGAAPVYAVDIDPQACQATLDNAKRNAIVDNFSVYTPNTMPQHRVDVVIANILLNPLLACHDLLVDYLKPKSQLVLSGILQEQKDLLIEHYASSLTVKELTCDQDWLCICFSKP